MKVILNKDVKDLGKVGEAVNVSAGHARNFLFPRNLASAATQKKVKEWEHLSKVAQIRQKKALADRQAIVDKLKDIKLTIQAAAGDTEKLFGSVTTMELAKALEGEGYFLDKRDLFLEEPIKTIGEHILNVKLGPGIEAKITVTVEKAS